MSVNQVLVENLHASKEYGCQPVVGRNNGPFISYLRNSKINKKKLKSFREHRISACDFLNNGIAESRNIFYGESIFTRECLQAKSRCRLKQIGVFPRNSAQPLCSEKATEVLTAEVTC